MNLFIGIQSQAIVRCAVRKCAEFLIYVLCAQFAHRVKIPRIRVRLYNDI